MSELVAAFIAAVFTFLLGIFRDWVNTRKNRPCFAIDTGRGQVVNVGAAIATHVRVCGPEEPDMWMRTRDQRCFSKDHVEALYGVANTSGQQVVESNGEVVVGVDYAEISSQWEIRYRDVFDREYRQFRRGGGLSRPLRMWKSDIVRKSEPFREWLRGKQWHLMRWKRRMFAMAKPKKHQ